MTDRIILVAIIVFAAVYAGFAFYRSTPKVIPAAVPTIAPAAKVDPVTTSAAVRQLFVQKYNWQLNDIELSVKNDDGTYASGGVNNTAETGGAMWFAAKVDGQWQLVFDGNGIITCDALQNYREFPKSIIPSCFDTVKNEIVQR